MHFDPTITLGNLISLAGTVAAIVGVYVRVSERLTRLETQMEMLMERRNLQRH